MDDLERPEEALDSADIDKTATQGELVLEEVLLEGGAAPPATENIAEEIVARSDDNTTTPPLAAPSEQSLYSVFSDGEKKGLLLVASVAAVISPFSTGVYYPSVNALARDLGVSVSLINLTISMYQIFQGLAPSVTASFSETYGRRPAYLLCFVVFFGANLGLALQDSFAALMVLRCLQSTGSSGTIVLGMGTVTDVTTRADRGKYMAWMTIGFVAGPALGPVIGGLLSQYLGWRAIFWFLLVMCGVVASIVVVFFRETSRSIVGDGSVPPPKWNWSMVQLFRRNDGATAPSLDSLEKRKTGVNPFTSLRLLGNRTNFIVCVYGALIFAGQSSMTSSLSSQLHERYGYNQVTVGLCYLPSGFGSLIARWTSGWLIDWNFRREAKKQGLEIVKNKQQDIADFNVEKARLAMSFPMVGLASCFIVAYGWLMEYRTPLAPILVMLFLISNSLTGILMANAALMMDVNRTSAASAGAAMNMLRFLLSAGGVAIATPLIDAIGIGATASIVAGIWTAGLPMLWVVYRYGFGWRKGESENESEKRRASMGEKVGT